MPREIDLYVERHRWMRGSTQDNLMKLYDSVLGKYDVIGCMLLRAGYTVEQLDGLRFPGTLSPDRRNPLLPPCEWMVSRAGVTTDACLELIALNDADMPEREREEKLFRKVLEHSTSRIKLLFVDFLPVEQTTMNLYKMARLGISWEEFERRARDNQFALDQAYAAAERSYHRQREFDAEAEYLRRTELDQALNSNPPGQWAELDQALNSNATRQSAQWSTSAVTTTVSGVNTAINSFDIVSMEPGALSDFFTRSVQATPVSPEEGPPTEALPEEPPDPPDGFWDEFFDEGREVDDDSR